MSRLLILFDGRSKLPQPELFKAMLSRISSDDPEGRIGIFSGPSFWVGWEGPESLPIAFDGVIYNAQELREELKSQGVRFHSTSDAELALRSYQRYGPECLARFNGDFALAIWDLAQGSLFCARDRLGVKPFYYFWDGRLFVAASEPKALFPHPEIRPEPDWKTVLAYAGTHYRYIDNRPEASFYANVQQLPAGCLLTLRDGQLLVKPYWKLVPGEIFSGTQEQCAQGLKEILEDSIRLRLQGVEHPAFALSSGMDSSSVLAVARRQLRDSPLIFSAVYGESPYDEKREIEPIAEALGRWNPVTVDGSRLFETVSQMVRQHDEPVCTVTWLAHHQLVHQASQAGAKVLFSGLGGDETMAGEYEHFFYFFADLKRWNELDRLNREVEGWIRLHDHPIYRKSWQAVEEAFRQRIDWEHPGKIRLDEDRFTAYRRALCPEFWSRYAFSPRMDHPTESYLLNRCYQDLFFETTPPCLRAGDRNDRSFGLQTRYPFLDHRVVEFSFRIPVAWKYRDGVTKWPLRQAMRGLLPEEARSRTTKTGWNAPSDLWFRKTARQDLSDLIHSRTFQERGVYEPKQVLQLAEEHWSGRANHMMFFWQLVNLELWLAQVHDCSLTTRA